MSISLEPFAHSEDRRLTGRIIGLTHLDPDVMTLDPIVVHRNHIEITEFARDRLGNFRVDREGWRYVTKRRVIRNPWPALAKREGR